MTNVASKVPNRVLRVVLVVCLFLFLAMCGRTPESGMIKTFRTNSGGVIEYGLVLPSDEDLEPNTPAILAVPTGHQRRHDVVRNLDQFWAKEAADRGWIVACPMSGRGFPLFWRDSGYFGDGSEVLIPPLLRELSAKLPVSNDEFHVVDVGGNGFSGLKIAEVAGSRVGSVTIVPFLGIDYSLLAAVAQKPGPSVLIAVSQSDTIDFEKRIRARSIPLTRVRVFRIPAPPMHSGTVEATAKNVNEVCDLISREIL